ncbi:MAG: LemA family protein [Alistipes sp.]
MGIIIAFVILGVIIVGIVSGGVAIYNRLVMLKYNVDKNFANIDVILKQRVDEIPNLIAVVKKDTGIRRIAVKSAYRATNRFSFLSLYR